MTEKELTRNIIRQAQQKADTMIKTAQTQAEQQIMRARFAAHQHQQQALHAAEQAAATAAAQQVKANEVVMIKARINAEQNVLDQAFRQARQRLIQADTATIKPIVDHLITRYAQPGDQITLAQTWSTARPDLPTTTAIDGGLIIENATYRQELTVDALLSAVREQQAFAIAQILGVR